MVWYLASSFAARKPWSYFTDTMHHSLSTGNLRVTWGISNSGSQLLELCRQSGGGEHWGRVTTANCTLLQLHSHPQPAVSVLHSANSLYLGFSFDRHSLPRRRTVSLNRGEDSRDQTEQLRDCHRASGACCLSIWLSLLHSSGKWRRKHPLKDSLEMCIKKTSQNHWSWEVSLQSRLLSQSTSTEVTSTISWNRNHNLILWSRCTNHLKVKQCSLQFFSIWYIVQVPSSSQESHSSQTFTYIKQPTSWKVCMRKTMIKAALQMRMRKPT